MPYRLRLESRMHNAAARDMECGSDARNIDRVRRAMRRQEAAVIKLYRVDDRLGRCHRFFETMSIEEEHTAAVEISSHITHKQGTQVRSIAEKSPSHSPAAPLSFVSLPQIPFLPRHFAKL